MIDNEDQLLDNLDQLLNQFGTFRRFQLLAFVGLLLIYCSLSFSIMQMVFAGMTPNWQCVFQTLEDTFQNTTKDQFEEAQRNISNYAMNRTNELFLFEADHDNQTFKVCSINGTKCPAFRFVGTSRTTVTEWGLVCDKSWIKDVMISVQMAGMLIGTLMSGQIGDYFGRKKVLYSFLLMCSFVELVTSFSVSWEMFTVCKFFVGIALGFIGVTAYPYLLEFYPQKLRHIVAAFPAFTIGISFFAGAAFVLDDWSSLHCAAFIFTTPFLFGWFFFPDSPRWLAVHGKIQAAEKAIEKIARFNGQPMPQGTVALIEKIAKKEKESRQTGRIYTVIDIFSSFHIAKISLSMGVLTYSLNTVSYGIIFGISSLDGNMFLNIFLMAIIQIPVQLTITYAVNRFGKRRAVIIYLSLAVLGSTLSLILSLAASNFSSKEALISGLSVFTKIFVGTTFNVVVLWNAELYPTVVRSIGYSFVYSFGRLGTVTAPFVVNFDQRAVASYGIITCLLVLSSLIALVSRETTGRPLPESLARTASFEPTTDLTLVEDNDNIQNKPVINTAKV